MKKLLCWKGATALLLLLLCPMLALADDVVTAPTITLNTSDQTTHSGTFTLNIRAESGLTLKYRISASKEYTSVDDLNNAYEGNWMVQAYVDKKRDYVVSAVAVKTDAEGNKTYSQVVNKTFTYKASTKIPVTLTASAVTVAVGSTATLTPTLSVAEGQTAPTDAVFSFKSEAIAIATVSGDNAAIASATVTGVKAGTTNITISYAGNDTYDAGAVVVPVTVESTATAADGSGVYKSIADLIHAGHSYTSDSKNYRKISNALIFESDNPATVTSKFTLKDANNGDLGAGYITITDLSGQSLLVEYDVKGKWHGLENLDVGTRFTGTIVSTYKELNTKISNNNDTSGEPYLQDLQESKKINNTTYTSSITTIASDAPIHTATLQDVNTINKASEDNALNAYWCQKVTLPGVIREGKGTKGGVEYYLVQDEDALYDEANSANRIYISDTQVSDKVSLADYVNASGQFVGLLMKRNGSESMLVLMDADFFTITTLYLDENDAENRIAGLIANGSLNVDESVDTYIHRTGLVTNGDSGIGTICLPFDMTAEDFKQVFGSELTLLAHATTTVSSTGIQTFESVSDKNITAGVPYVFKATGTQTAGNGATTADATYYAYAGQRSVTTLPQEVEANYDDSKGNGIVNGDFYFRGLYGTKTSYVSDTETGATTAIYDGGSQKYQYISTTNGVLKYPNSESVKFKGFRAYYYFANWDKTKHEAYKNSGKSDSSAKAFTISIDGETTGISTIDGQEASANSLIFNLQGQPVGRERTALQKGIYVQNGKKFVVK